MLKKRRLDSEQQTLVPTSSGITDIQLTRGLCEEVAGVRNEVGTYSVRYLKRNYGAYFV